MDSVQEFVKDLYNRPIAIDKALVEAEKEIVELREALKFCY